VTHLEVVLHLCPVETGGRSRTLVWVMTRRLSHPRWVPARHESQVADAERQLRRLLLGHRPGKVRETAQGAQIDADSARLPGAVEYPSALTFWRGIIGRCRQSSRKPLAISRHCPRST
jgi:hypothetical protein